MFSHIKFKVRRMLKNVVAEAIEEAFEDDARNMERQIVRAAMMSSSEFITENIELSTKAQDRYVLMRKCIGLTNVDGLILELASGPASQYASLLNNFRIVRSMDSILSRDWTSPGFFHLRVHFPTSRNCLRCHQMWNSSRDISRTHSPVSLSLIPVRSPCFTSIPTSTLRVAASWACWVSPDSRLHHRIR